MIKQMNHLIKLQLRNIFGINVFRFSKDKKEKKKKSILAITYLFLVVMAAFYVSTTVYGYIMLGLEEMVPAYLIMLSSFIILFFSVFKAGDIIFQKNAHDDLAENV